MVRKNVLLKEVHGRVQGKSLRRGIGANQQEVRLGEDEEKQSNGKCQVSLADAADAQGHRPQANLARRQRRRNTSSSETVSGPAGMEIGDGNCDADEARVWISNVLQDGYREFGIENRDRCGRIKPCFAFSASSGSEEGRSLEEVRVDSAEVLKSTSDGTFGGLCSDGFVYNIEVEEHHNYLANGILVHNCHHVLSDSYQEILGHFTPAAKVLGVTATPDRGDKRNLGKYFENMAHEVSLLELIKEGFLSRINIKTIPIKIDLRGVRVIAGDYDAEQLDESISRYLFEIAKAISNEAAFRKVLVFLPLIKTSLAFTEICKGMGMAAEHIDGMSPDREEILKRFHRNEIDVLSNAMLLTEGFDQPDVDCVVVLRPTKVRSLYSQMVGRGTRVAPGKQNLLVLDFLWMHEKHDLVKPAHLIAKTATVADEMQAIQDKGGEIELEELEQMAIGRIEERIEQESEAKKQREDKLKQAIKENAGRDKRMIDAMDFFTSLHEVENAEYLPEFAWEKESPSEKQLLAISRMGINPESVTCNGHASKILDRAFSRTKLGLATAKQLMWLRKLKHPSPETATFKEAKEFLDLKFNAKPAVSFIPKG